LWISGKFPRAPLLWLLLAAEASDLMWVGLNLLQPAGGATLEVSRARQPFRYIGDLLLLEQPYSHSLLGNLLLASALALVAYLAFRKTGAAASAVALPVFLAVAGHWLLDFIVHDADLALSPLPGAAAVGPAFSLDPAAPARGLSTVHPLVSWSLQTLLVLFCARSFLRAFPTERKRRAAVYLALGLLSLLPAPLFLEGVGDGIPRTTSGLVLLTLVEIALGIILLHTLITRWTHPQMRTRFGPYAPELAQRLRGGQTVAAALALALGASYLLQAMLASQSGPRTGLLAMALAACYGALAAALLGRSLSAWWLALFFPLLAGPLGRFFSAPGPLGLVHAALEASLALLAALSIHRMLTSRLVL
jgi:hypothetical protein